MSTSTPAPRRSTATSKPVQSVERALQLLRAVATSTEPQPLSHLASACDLNRQTAWRLLLTLEQGGFVERDHSGQRYVLGREIQRLSTVGGHDALIALARPVVDELARTAGEVAYLDVPTARGLRVLYETQPPGRLLPSAIGSELPLHCSAAGKLVLAHMPAAECQAHLRAPLQRWTEQTEVDPERILAELAVVRERGYSLSRDEYEADWSAIGAPVLDDGGALVAAVTLWARTVDMPDERIDALAGLVRQAGHAITERLAAA